MSLSVTKDMTIKQILRTDIGIAEILTDAGMHCLGCPASRGETVEEACMVHGVDCNALLEKLNQEIASKEA